MKIFLIKVKNFNSEIVEVITAYDNETSAKQHIESYEEIYRNDLKSEIWYDYLIMESEFNNQE